MARSLAQPLENIYGPEWARQLPRYESALQRFRHLYGPGPIHLFRAPGRVNLIGEHTDYNHGYVLPAALDRDMILLMRPRQDAHLHLANMEPDYPTIDFEIGPEIAPEEAGAWGNYARGAAQAMARTLKQPVHGFDSLLAGAAPFGVPRGSGVSSSSALTVVIATALAHFVDWDQGAVALAHLTSDAEWYVGTRGGIMDQFTSILARRDHALFLDCRPDNQQNYALRHIPLPDDHRLMVAESGVHHRNVRNEFNQRVAAGRAGVGLLRRRYGAITHLRDVEEIEWADLVPLLPETITVAELAAQGVSLGDIPGVTPETGLRVLACCRHVWSENRRVLAAVNALESGEIGALGHLLQEAHASARDDYQISCPELEVLVDAAQEVEGVAGSRLTGAGWGGCTISLVHQDAVAEFEEHVQTRFLAQVGRPTTIFSCRSGAGAGLVAVQE